ncbi:ABC transporter permease [Occallatibacter savannae]|uniref:ABC transporter permease n=1 Tax=Occallatibacter savannae TaxID=1002691 RepID=UPI000D69232C|nr:ABC transporter permease [Occallatibacter savannae]
MSKIMRELRFSIRQLRKSPGFALIVIVTLALGIGATTAVFSLVERVLLRPFPFADPERLVILGDHIGAGVGTPVTAREIRIYSEATTAFKSMGGYEPTGYELSGGEAPEAIPAARLSFGVFDTLGVHPVLGRFFTRAEDEGHQPVVVISYALWQNRFHRDPGVLGTGIQLDRKFYTIVGVMPRSFDFPVDTTRLNQAQLWVPLSLTAQELSDADAGFFGYQIIARLNDGVSLASAAQDAERASDEVMRNYPATMSSVRIRSEVTSLRDYVVGQVRPALRGLFAAVAVVLLIGCVNVAVLMLVRAIRRRRESAVRLALGARASAIVRESFLEGLVLSLIGAVFGIGIAALALRLSLRFLSDSLPRVNSVAIDWRVAVFAFALALVTGILSSLAPAFAAVQANITDALKESTRGGSTGRQHAWLRSSLIAAEIAIALVLLTTCGAFLRSYQKMLAVDPGFRADHVLVAGFQLPKDQYRSYIAENNFNRELMDRLSSKPGTVAVGISSMVPGSGNYGRGAYTIEGQPIEGWKLQWAVFATIFGDYFKSLGIPLLEGRTFTSADRANAPLVAIVNQSMAKHCWPGQDPIGKRMHVGNPHKGLPWATVVGVVADAKVAAPDAPSEDQWYVPTEQPATLFGADPSTNVVGPTGGFITLRSTLPPEQLIQTLRETVASIDPLLPLQQVQSMAQVVSDVEAPRRFNTDLITAFAFGALVLAVTGIYAVVAFSISIRAQEIAIRMALGAQRGSIARLVLLSGAKLALVGCAAGLIGSYAASRVVGNFLFQVSPTDPLIYAGGAIIMIVVALLASAVPAARAASSDPVKALRAV